MKQICATEDELIEEITQPKDFNTRVHLEYNKILICDDQTNNSLVLMVTPRSLISKSLNIAGILKGKEKRKMNCFLNLIIICLAVAY